MNITILCFKIFIIRIIDMTLGTLGTIIVVKGKSIQGAAIGFVQILLWFLVVKEALNFDAPNYISNLLIGISYALGYAVGTYIGSIVSKKLINNNISVQVITDKYIEISNHLRQIGYGVSIIEIEGYDETIDRKMLIIETNNKNLNNVKNVVNKYDNAAFIIINESTLVINGYAK